MPARTIAQASVAQVLSGVSRSTWIVLAFCHMLRRQAEESGSAIHRRVMATVCERVLTLRASPPRALKSFAVGVTDRLALVYRDSSGKLSDEHPASGNKALIRDGAALAANGRCVEPQLPPPDSPYELCPDTSGGICYLNRDLGTAQWDPPPSSTPLQQSAFEDAPAFSSPLPLYQFGMGLNALHGTRWEPIFEDAASRVRLYNVDTGSDRNAPWISLRTPEGCVFFANLVSHETCWFPPRTWMAGWVCRPHVDDSPNAMGETIDSPFAGFTLGRQLLPMEFARLHVEGGAPCLLNPSNRS